MSCLLGIADQPGYHEAWKYGLSLSAESQQNQLPGLYCSMGQGRGTCDVFRRTLQYLTSRASAEEESNVYLLVKELTCASDVESGEEDEPHEDGAGSEDEDTDEDSAVIGDEDSADPENTEEAALEKAEGELYQVRVNSKMGADSLDFVKMLATMTFTLNVPKNTRETKAV